MATVIDDLLVILGFRANTSGADRFDNRLGGIIKTVGKVGGALAGVGLVAAGFLGKGVIDAASQFENFKTQLTTIEGSSEKAQKSLDWIADFAKKTPYELDQVTDAFVKMKSYGLDPIEGGLLESIGNMASGMGKSIDQAVEAIADAATGENERLKEFGIKGSKDKKTGEITYTYNTADGKKFTKTVANDAKEITTALQQIMDQKFAGGMDAMSKTWEGTVSNMKDAYGGFLRAIADAGVFEKLKDLLGIIAAWVNENGDKITAFAEKIGAAFIIMIDVLVAAYDQIVIIYNKVQEFMNWLSANSETIITTLKTIGAIAAVIAGALVLMYAPAIAGFLLMQATGVLSFLILQAAAIASAVATAAAWLIAFAPFLLIGAVIAVVIGLLWLIYQNWQQIVTGLAAEWERLKAMFMAGVASISAWWSGLMASISSAFSSVVGYISAAWSGLWGGVRAIAGSAIDFVIGKIQSVIGMITGAIGKVKELAAYNPVALGGKAVSWAAGKLGIGGGGNTSSVNQTFNVSSAGEATSIAKGSTGAQRRSNTGVKQ